jgi:hypothetical protein
MSNDISSRDDIIDSRDVIARIEELESERDGLDTDEERNTWDNDSEGEELKALKGLAEEAEGYGDWAYGEALIRDSYFAEYAEQLAEDIGDYNSREVRWPYTCIDWGKAAEELKRDYTSVEFDGVTYWMRA